MPECAICAAINAEYDRLGVPDTERPTYTTTLAQQGDVLTQLQECADLAELQSLAERGVIADA